MAWFKKNDTEWEDTRFGKKFMNRLEIIAEENERKKREFEEKTPPERMEQYKLFKKIFPFYFFAFSLSLLFTPISWWKWVIPIQIGIVLINLLFFFKPYLNPIKKVKYKSVYMMALIAFFSSLIVCSTILLQTKCTIDNYNKNITETKIEAETEIENNIKNEQGE